jgi:hypothetical protein
MGNLRNPGGVDARRVRHAAAWRSWPPAHTSPVSGQLRRPSSHAYPLLEPPRAATDHHKPRTPQPRDAFSRKSIEGTATPSEGSASPRNRIEDVARRPDKLGESWTRRSAALFGIFDATPTPARRTSPTSGRTIVGEISAAESLPPITATDATALAGVNTPPASRRSATQSTASSTATSEHHRWHR